MELEDIFKLTIEHYGFLNSKLYESTWLQQIVYIDTYWDRLICELKIEDVQETFIQIAARKQVEYQKFNIVDNLAKSLNEWRIELMTRVANRISQFITDEVTGNFVKWNGKEMEFLFKLEEAI